MPLTESHTFPERRRRPVITWVLMVLSLGAALFLLDWSSMGIPKSLWFFALPSVLGFAGTGFALYARRGGWALVSGVWGIMMVPALVAVVTVISGP